jgi:hypothetical protein
LFRSGKAGISARNRSKSAAKRPVFALREQERVPNRKKVAKKSEFLFLQEADRPSGADSAKDAWRAADLAQDARYRGDGDEASFREKESGSSPSSRYCPSFLAIQTRGFKIIAPLLISRVLVLSALIRAVAAGFLLLGEQCVLCRIACKK